MIYECINCGKQWGCVDDTDEFKYNTSGLCKICFKNRIVYKIRQKQIYEGFTDCFCSGKATCCHFDCCYRLACLYNIFEEETVFPEFDIINTNISPSV